MRVWRHARLRIRATSWRASSAGRAPQTLLWGGRVGGTSAAMAPVRRRRAARSAQRRRTPSPPRWTSWVPSSSGASFLRTWITSDPPAPWDVDGVLPARMRAKEDFCGRRVRRTRPEARFFRRSPLPRGDSRARSRRFLIRACRARDGRVTVTQARDGAGGGVPDAEQLVSERAESARRDTITLCVAFYGIARRGGLSRCSSTSAATFSARSRSAPPTTDRERYKSWIRFTARRRFRKTAELHHPEMLGRNRRRGRVVRSLRNRRHLRRAIATRETRRVVSRATTFTPSPESAWCTRPL